MNRPYYKFNAGQVVEVYAVSGAFLGLARILRPLQSNREMYKLTFLDKDKITIKSSKFLKRHVSMPANFEFEIGETVEFAVETYNDEPLDGKLTQITGRQRNTNGEQFYRTLVDGMEVWWPTQSFRKTTKEE